VRDPNCPCLAAGPQRDARTRRFVGVDQARGRFGDVVTWTCTHCDREWLRYSVEYEGHSRSGRWFLGVLQDGQTTDAAGAVDVLAGLAWYLAGGSYFGGGVHRTQGAPAVDL